jgi:hypothetical protein
MQPDASFSRGTQEVATQRAPCLLSAVTWATVDWSSQGLVNRYRCSRPKGQEVCALERDKRFRMVDVMHLKTT